MSLNWNKTDALDFREYKLYRHTTSGLDETTGTLVHVATSILDTSFIDTDLQPFKNYFYRVYIMNDYGRLGGSNIVNDTTKQINIIWNGDFESQENLLNWWTSYNAIEYKVTDSIKKIGNYSLFLHADTTDTPNGNTIVGARFEKFFNSSELDWDIGRTYKLSGWMRTDGYTVHGFSGPVPNLGGAERQACVKIVDENTYAAIYCPANTEWEYFEKTFIKGTQGTWGYIYIFTICEYTWFDDLKITLVE